MIYKKGSIVPRCLVRCKNRKTQHLIKFGCDVAVNRHERSIVAITDGAAIVCSRGFIGGKNGTPKIINSMIISNIHFTSFDCVVAK